MKLINAIGIAFTLLLASQLAAASPQQLMDHLHTMRLASTEAITGFYMYSGLDANRRYERRIDVSQDRFEQALEKATQFATLSQVNDELEQISQDWQRIKKLMTENRDDMRNQGFPNVRLVDQMGRYNLDMVESIGQTYEKVQTNSGVKPNPMVDRIRTLALLMEEMTSQYSARSTSNLGQVFVGFHNRTLAEMADDFHAQLTELQNLINDPKTDNLMNSINSKWRFLERSVRNYNENTVPFIVISFNDRIIQDFSELETFFK